MPRGFFVGLFAGVVVALIGIRVADWTSTGKAIEVAGRWEAVATEWKSLAERCVTAAEKLK